MNAQDLIASFSRRTTLPVDVNDVIELVRKNGEEIDIEFIGVDLDPEILQGQIKVFYVRDGVYAEPRKCANIYYHRGHAKDWQRLICCKELIHLVDPEAARTTTSEGIDALAEKIGLPPEMQNPTADGFEVNVDRVAEWRAAAILLPLAAREVLMPFYSSGAITAAEIGRLADIPRKYAAFVMSDAWPAVHDLLIGKGH